MKRKGYNLHCVVHLITRHLLGISDDAGKKEYERMSRETGLLKEDGEIDDVVKSAFQVDILADKRRKQAYRQFRQYTQQKKRPVLHYWRRVAAVAFLLMTIGGGIYYFIGITEDKVLYTQEITPTQARAYLLLSDGSRVDLSVASNDSRIYTNNVAVCDSGKLEYGRLAEKEGQVVAFNQICVPRGGEYHLVLSDGTRVWINADSELKYPVRFGSGSREVYVKGEAYFEVEKDAAHPFIVHTSKGAVKVLGTEFNVRDYKDEPGVITTLVKGLIEYRTASSRVILNPGFQSVDINNKVVVKSVNTEEYVGWKDGKYVFFDESLESLMRYVERAYDVEVFFTNEDVKKLRFSGDLQRYDRVELFLRYLENGGDVRFTVQDRTITVYKK